MRPARLIAIIAGGVFLGLCACGVVFFALPSLMPKKTYDMEYVVIAQGGASITYQNATGDTAQMDTNQKQWNFKFKGYSGDFVYVSEQTHGSMGACFIGMDGSVFKQTQSTGDYSIATCSGRLP